MIVAEEPGPKKPHYSKPLRPETTEKLKWLKDHPGEWLLWGHRMYNCVDRNVKGVDFERAYRRQPDKSIKTYVRYVPKPRLSDADTP